MAKDSTTSERKLTANDIYERRFRTVLLGGYSKNEVDLFLENVAEQYEKTLKRLEEIESLEKKYSAIEEEMSTFRSMEHTLRDALVSSQKFGESIIETAKRNADAMIAEAKLIRTQARVAAAELPDALRDEINELKAQRNLLRSELITILETHQSLAAQIQPAEDVVLEMAGEADDEDDPEPTMDSKQKSRTPLTIEKG